LPKTPRTWKGARTPSGLKRVRQAEAREKVLQPRRSAAKTLVAKTLRLASERTNGTDANATLLEALSALDRAAKSGAIHPNAAARRKSRLTRHVNKALGGVRDQTVGHAAKTTSKAQAAKAARARIAASKADKAKGAQTAAGKARAALTRTSRTEGGAATAAEQTTAGASRAAAKPKATAARTPSAKPEKKSASTKPAAKKAAAPKSTTAKKATPKKPAAKTTASSAAKKPAKG
jgi:ribosomal protein S20